MYRIEVDLHNARLCYIYEDGENFIRYKMTVVGDLDLAHRVVDFLNSGKEEVKQSV